MARIYKTARNGWAYQASYGTGAERKRSFKSGFKTKRAATEAAAVLERAFDQKLAPDAGDTPFAEHFTNWYTTYKLGKFSKTTDDWYKTAANYIDGYFGKKPINQIDRGAYQRFLNHLAKHGKVNGDPLAKSTVSRVNAYVRAAVLEAVDEGAINRNFTRRAILSGTDGKNEQTKFLSLNDFNALVVQTAKVASIRRINAYIILCQAYTGMRFEEALGLTWADIDFSHQLVKVNRSWKYKTHQQYDNFGDLKTPSSKRRIPVPPAFLTMMHRLKREQDRTYLAEGYRDPDNLCFRNIQHNVNDNTAVNHTLRRLCKTAKTAHVITTHGLRHTHGSVLLYAGVDILSVSQRLGHSKIETTMNTYAHVIDEMTARDQKQIISTLSNILKS